MSRAVITLTQADDSENVVVRLDVDPPFGEDTQYATHDLAVAAMVRIQRASNGQVGPTRIEGVNGEVLVDPPAWDKGQPWYRRALWWLGWRP